MVNNQVIIRSVNFCVLYVVSNNQFNREEMLTGCGFIVSPMS